MDSYCCGGVFISGQHTDKDISEVGILDIIASIGPLCLELHPNIL